MAVSICWVAVGAECQACHDVRVKGIGGDTLLLVGLLQLAHLTLPWG